MLSELTKRVEGVCLGWADLISIGKLLYLLLFLKSQRDLIWELSSLIIYLSAANRWPKLFGSAARVSSCCFSYFESAANRDWKSIFGFQANSFCAKIVIFKERELVGPNIEKINPWSLHLLVRTIAPLLPISSRWRLPYSFSLQSLSFSSRIFLSLCLISSMQGIFFSRTLIL
jgi:hypothetical protein